MFLNCFHGFWIVFHETNTPDLFLLNRLLFKWVIKEITIDWIFSKNPSQLLQNLYMYSQKQILFGKSYFRVLLRTCIAWNFVSFVEISVVWSVWFREKLTTQACSVTYRGLNGEALRALEVAICLIVVGKALGGLVMVAASFNPYINTMTLSDSLCNLLALLYWKRMGERMTRELANGYEKERLSKLNVLIVAFIVKDK